MYSYILQSFCKVDAVLPQSPPSTPGIYLRTWTSHLIKGEPAVPGFSGGVGETDSPVFCCLFWTLPTVKWPIYR